MMTLSIGKTLSIKAIAPAFLVGTVSAAAIVYAFTQIPGGPKVESGPIGLLSQPPQPQSGATKPASAAVVNADTSGPSSATPALASTQSKVAALSAELGTAPSAPAAEPPLPAFDVARVESGGDAVIAGRAAPGAAVDLMRGGEKLDQAVADASGQFVMVPQHLPAGSYELTLSAKLPDGTMALSKQGVTVTVKEAEAPTSSIAARTETALAATAPTVVAKPLDTAAAPPRQAMAAAASDEGASRSSSAGASTRVVNRGDSLWRISRIAYGAGEQYAIVYRANRDRIRDPNLIHPGQVLVVPLRHR